MTVDQGALETLRRDYCDIVAVAERCGMEVERDGSRYRGCCLWHDERTPSLVLYPDGNDYHCFGCGAHGDAITMVQHAHSLDFLDAVRFLSEMTGYWPDGLTAGDGSPVTTAPPPKPPQRIKADKRRKWSTVVPVPDRVPAPTAGALTYFHPKIKRKLEPAAWWCYRDMAGQLLGCDARYEYTRAIDDDRWQVGDQAAHAAASWEVVEVRDGELVLQIDEKTITAATTECKKKCKDVITWTWSRHLEEARQEWKPRAWDGISPLYGAEHLRDYPYDRPVIIAEGCKAADGARRALGLPALTWRGGAQTVAAFDKNDWSILRDRHVVIWPDADPPGLFAAAHIARHLRKIGAASARIIDTHGLPKGYDLADYDDQPIEVPA